MAEDGDYPDTVGEAVSRAAQRWPNRPAVIDGDQRLTYLDLEDQVHCVGRALLARGVRRGDRIGIWAPNSAEWIVAALAVRAVGAWLIPINTRYKRVEAADVLRRARVRMVFTVSGFLGFDYPELLAQSDLPDLDGVFVFRGESVAAAETWVDLLAGGRHCDGAALLERLASVGPDDVSDVLFTSGTTGKPKGAALSHGRTCRAMSDWIGVMTMTGEHRQLGVNPFFHIFGLSGGILATLLAGASIYPVATFDVDKCLQLIQDERLSMLLGPPTIFESILRHPRLGEIDVSCLDLAMVTAATVPPSLVDEMFDTLRFRHVVTAYGLTEAGGALTMAREGDGRADIVGGSGRALKGVTLKIVDDNGQSLPAGVPGEILARSPSTMLHYLDDPESTVAAVDDDGFLRTGDIGFLDDADLLHVTDRKKDMFTVGGFNVYSAEVELKLLAHPSIAEVAVVGVPDRRLGSVGFAFVVPKPGHVIDPNEFLTWARGEMANFKVPRHVEIVDTFPTSAVGKTLKYALRDQAAAVVETRG